MSVLEPQLSQPQGSSMSTVTSPVMAQHVSALWGETCGAGFSCPTDYHCCSQSSGICCPDGFFCSGTSCTSLIIVIFPCIVAALILVVAIIVIITCRKLKAKGIKMQLIPEQGNDTKKKPLNNTWMDGMAPVSQWLGLIVSLLVYTLIINIISLILSIVQVTYNEMIIYAYGYLTYLNVLVCY